MKFEYVASAATGYLRLSTKVFKKYWDNDPEFKNFYTVLITKLKNTDDHKFSVLFNALTEHNQSKVNWDVFSDKVDKIYSDSGGLQMITLGKKNVDKNKIFKTQSEYSHVGMSFDDIPVKILGESSITNTMNRYYDPSILIECAKNTATDLKNQINYMMNNPKNICQPMMILQGNDFDSYQTWIDIHDKILTSTEKNYIHGISLGGAALGTGFLDDIKKIFYFTKLKFPDEINTQNIHLLGIGAMYRFLPLLALEKNLTDKNISYDSSTHTCTVVLGDYYTNYSKKRPSRYKNKFFYQILDDMNEFVKDTGIVFTEDALYKSIWYPKLSSELQDEKIKLYVIFAYFAIQAKNFMLDLNKLQYDNVERVKFMDKLNYYSHFNSLSFVDDMKQFNEWVNICSHTIPRNSIENLNNQAASLEDYI